MSHDDIVSAGELSSFIEALGIDKSEQPVQQRELFFKDLHQPGRQGWLMCDIYMGWNDPNGGRIDVHEAIKSFGIRFTGFHPMFQRFEFDEAEQALIISDDTQGYRFSLQLK